MNDRMTSFLGVLSILVGVLLGLWMASSTTRKTLAQPPEIQTAPAAAVSAVDPNLATAPLPSLDSTDDPGLKMSNTEGYVYDPSGRRDPFLAPMLRVRQEMVQSSDPETAAPPDQSPTPSLKAEQGGSGDSLATYSLRDIRVIAIIWNVKRPKAMVQLPNSRVYTIGVKTQLARERAVVAAIREKEVVVVQPAAGSDYSQGQVRVLRMLQ